MTLLDVAIDLSLPLTLFPFLGLFVLAELRGWNE